MEKFLLHACCAPCSVKCVDSLRKEGIEPALFWFNPNIHPYTEYQNRLSALRQYAAGHKLELTEHGIYGLRPFIENIADNIEGRCGYCYWSRLVKTAEYAADNGYSQFSTTLLISPYQRHEMIAAAAKKAAERCGVEFVYRDFRPMFREGQAAARSEGFYMQKYCGCVFSEEERYMGNKE